MGRPLSRPGIGSSTQRMIAWHLARGCTQEKAAKLAGVTDPRRIATFARSAQFADELRRALGDYITLDITPEAVRVLRQIMNDEKMPPRARIDSAKAILDRGGLSAGAKPETAPADVSEMSIDQLNALISNLEEKARQEEDRRAEAATVIDVLE